MKAPSSHKKEKLLVIQWLIEHFPLAFFKNPKEVRPLQIGIFEDILSFYDRLDTPAFSKKLLRESLHFYSQSPAYLKAQITGAARLDLYGNEVDVVTEDQARYAYQRYTQRYVAHAPSHEPK